MNVRDIRNDLWNLGGASVCRERLYGPTFYSTHGWEDEILEHTRPGGCVTTTVALSTLPGGCVCPRVEHPTQPGGCVDGEYPAQPGGCADGDHAQPVGGVTMTVALSAQRGCVCTHVKHPTQPGGCVGGG